jgi:hypothetical protein
MSFIFTVISIHSQLTVSLLIVFGAYDFQLSELVYCIKCHHKPNRQYENMPEAESTTCYLYCISELDIVKIDYSGHNNRRVLTNENRDCQVPEQVALKEGGGERQDWDRSR